MDFRFPTSCTFSFASFSALLHAAEEEHPSHTRGPCSSPSQLAPQVLHGGTVETSFSVPSADRRNNLPNSSPVRGPRTFPSSQGALNTCYRDLGPVCHEAAMPVWGIYCTLLFVTSHFYVLLPLSFWLLQFSIISLCSLPSRKRRWPAFSTSLGCRHADGPLKSWKRLLSSQSMEMKEAKFCFQENDQNL